MPLNNLITISYRSTHFYLVDCRGGKLLVDAGWAGSMPVFQSLLKQYQVPLAGIQFVMATHYHPDHAGILQDIKQAAGARLIIHEKQVPFIAELTAFYQRKGGYTPIRIEPGDLVLPSPNGALLKAAGIPGEIIETPGHSPDSVSLVTEAGEAFTGDLTRPDLAGEENSAQIRQSWNTLLALKVRHFYPAHGSPFSAADLKKYL